MNASRIEHDRLEICRRSGMERRIHISAMIASHRDQRDHRERRSDTHILRDNEAITLWMSTFHDCRD